MSWRWARRHAARSRCIGAFSRTTRDDDEDVLAVIDIWGTPEVVASADVGRLVARQGLAFSAAIQSLQGSGLDRSAVRRYAEGFSWQSTTDAQLSLFRSLVGFTREPSHA